MKKNILLIILLTISGTGLYYYESPKMKIQTQSKIKELTTKIIDEESVFDSKSNLLNTFYKKKSNNNSFIKWFLVYYFGASTLLLLSLHSYCMGSVF